MRVLTDDVQLKVLLLTPELQNSGNLAAAFILCGGALGQAGRSGAGTVALSNIYSIYTSHIISTNIYTLDIRDCTADITPDGGTREAGRDTASSA